MWGGAAVDETHRDVDHRVKALRELVRSCLAELRGGKNRIALELPHDGARRQDSNDIVIVDHGKVVHTGFR